MGESSAVDHPLIFSTPTAMQSLNSKTSRPSMRDKDKVVDDVVGLKGSVNPVDNSLHGIVGVGPFSSLQTLVRDAHIEKTASSATTNGKKSWKSLAHAKGKSSGSILEEGSKRVRDGFVVSQFASVTKRSKVSAANGISTFSLSVEAATQPHRDQ